MTTNVKGTALASTIRYITEKFGPEGLERVLARLTPEERAPIKKGVLATVWYPFALLLKLMREARECFGTQVPHLPREMGKASADYALTGIYSIFLRFGSPQFIVSRGTSVMKTYYSTGEMRVVTSEKGHAVMEVVGFGEPAPEFCERLEGWMHRTVELSGGTGCRLVHEKCVNRGDTLCRFEGWWS